MDEEKEQNNGQAQNTKSVLSNVAKKQAEKGKRKVFKKMIIVLVAKLLIAFCIAFGIYLFISSVLHYLDVLDSNESKEASTSAIVYSSNSSKANKIVVNNNNITSDGAYELTYKFKDEEGKSCTEQEAIKIIKRNLLKQNEKIDLEAFTESELKIIGTLMNNGLETGKYSEEELKALVVFVKADIAGKSYNLSSGNRKKVKVENIANKDEVYGTIDVHKTTVTDDGYKEIKLEYVPYSTLKNMINSTNNSALNKFSVDSKGNIVIAKASSNIIKHEYQGANGSGLSETEMAKIETEDDVEEYIMKEYTIPVNSEQYLSKYIASYGFLSDLLIATQNVNFCLEIAEIALNSKIVLNIKEEKTVTNTYEKTNYSQTTLEYDYVSYQVTGYNILEEWKSVASGSGSPNGNSTLSVYGWNGSVNASEGSKTFEWTYNDEDYELNYTSSPEKWSLSRCEVVEKTESSSPKKVGTQELIVGGHISESYENYAIDEDYTSKKEYNYTVITETSSINYKYDIDISEIDCWYLTYKRPYTPPKVTTTPISPPEDVDGEFPEEATVVQETTNNASIIGSNAAVSGFIERKEQEYINNNPEVDEAECVITGLTIKSKSKTSSKVQEYEGARTTYKFGDESELDTTQVQFKNMEYVNNIPTYTSKGEKGFLYVYDKYITGGIDLCLKNDAEKELFEMLEVNEETVNVSDVMRFLLYVYDGIDRGITDLDKTFKVIDISTVSKGGIGVSAFGCNLTKEEFIAATEKYQGDSILATLAELFYDICTLPEYNVNPCLAYTWAAYESGWGKSAVDDKNLFQMGTYTDQTSGFRYDSYEDSIKAFCQWVVNASDPSTNLYSFCYTRAEDYATVNNKFKGTPDNNIYALFSTYANVGYVHNGNTRACIKNAYNYLNDGIYECNHADDDPPTMQERADYMDWIISSRIDLAKTIFGIDCFVGHGSLVEAAYEVADHFMNSGVTVHYAAKHKGGNNIILPDQHNIQACYDLPFERPETYGIVCTTFVNLAIWKAGLIDTETMNTFAIHSPIRSAVSMQSLDGWEIIDSADELQEGDVVWSEGHTWIYMDGDKMLDQSYCVINSSGADTRGVLKDARGALAGFKKGFRYVGS